ncbi:MAG TPA: hypothetical protein VEQ85_16520 [Lacipirellulaceae bacterium]|nr:hypothetical protein [Lacipirellulaceae bacterium]
MPKLSRGSPRAAGWMAFCLLAGHTAAVRGQDAKPWEIAPYTIRVSLAVDTSARPQSRLAAEIARTIQQRVDSALRPLWAMELAVAADAKSRRAAGAPVQPDWEGLTPQERAFDKLFLLDVRAVPTGYTATCREFDAYTRRWGPLLTREVSQEWFLAEACFRILADAFTPIARVESPNDEGRSRLIMKGGALPRPPGEDLIVAPGDVFLPLMRRSGRGGELARDGIAPIPWTFLVVEAPDRSGWSATVHSAIRGVLSGRRRGSIEQIAVGLEGSAPPPRVRFFARSNPRQGLAGYEVYRTGREGAEPELLGLTDHQGLFSVPPSDEPVTTLLLRSEGQVLAKLLVAAGAGDVVEAPIADDAVRLAAEGEVQAVREELIDVVARRAILVARIQALLKKGAAAEARALMDALNELPTPGVFSKRIDEVRDRLPESGDPRVQKRVDELFAATREMLGRFLDARVITNLQAEVNAAARGGS